MQRHRSPSGRQNRPNRTTAPSMWRGPLYSVRSTRMSVISGEGGLRPVQPRNPGLRESFRSELAEDQCLRASVAASIAIRRRVPQGGNRTCSYRKDQGGVHITVGSAHSAEIADDHGLGGYTTHPKLVGEKMESPLPRHCSIRLPLPEGDVVVSPRGYLRSTGIDGRRLRGFDLATGAARTSRDESST